MRKKALLGGGVAAAMAAAMLSGCILAGATAASAGTNVGGIEAETMVSETGAGALVYNDSTASAGKALEVTDAVTVKGTISTTQSADSFWVKAHTDAGAGTAYFNLKVDGVTAASNFGVAWTTWGAYKITGNWAAGTHKVEITFNNPAALNLYLDDMNFATSQTQTSTPTATPPPTASGTETGTIVHTAYTTGYGYWDNTPAGSSTISNPVIHQQAGGTGTWSDPVTVAVGHSLATGSDVLDYPAGTKFYVPSVQKYFITEDTCGDGATPQNIPCHNLTNPSNPAPAGDTTWIDLWVGGASGSQSVSNACENTLTDTHTIIVNPSVTNYKVITGDIVSSAGCHAGYGETLYYQ